MSDAPDLYFHRLFYFVVECRIKTIYLILNMVVWLWLDFIMIIVKWVWLKQMNIGYFDINLEFYVWVVSVALVLIALIYIRKKKKTRTL